MKARVPCVDKEYKVKTKQIIQITKSYLPFRGKVIESLVEHDQNKSNVKIEEPTQNKSKTIITNNNINDLTKDDEKKKTKISKSEFSEEELNDPEFCLDNLKSFEVLQRKTKQLEDEAAKIEGRLPKDIRERLMKTRVKKNVNNITNQCNRHWRNLYKTGSFQKIHI